MTPPSGSLVPPPPRADAGPPQGGKAEGPPARYDGAETATWARRNPGRVRAIAFGVSAGVHLLALLLYPEITVRFGEVQPTADATAPAAVQGMEVVNLQEASADEVEAPDSPEDQLALDVVPTVTLARPPGEDLAPVAPRAPTAPGLSAADRLRPATREERLWIALVPEASTLTDQEILQTLIYGQLQAFNDSMAVRAAQAARGTDWTYTDEDGNRWGISPGKLHLGSITIPLPFSFGSPTGASDDALDALWMDREIRRAAGQLEADATVEERAAAIRARIDAERERARSGTPPDSTRRGGGGGGGR